MSGKGVYKLHQESGAIVVVESVKACYGVGNEAFVNNIIIM